MCLEGTCTTPLVLGPDQKNKGFFGFAMQSKALKRQSLAFGKLAMIGKDVREDVAKRLPFYWSDWTDAWNYRVIPSVVYIFFANILPAIAFAQDMFDRTDGSFGLNEVLMSSAMGGVVFGLIGGQPLCIVGVTGPITIFIYTVFEIVVPKNVNFFAFMAWCNIWSFLMHVLIALLNGVRLMKYITQFSADIFGCFINIIYIEKGVQILIRQFEPITDSTNAADTRISLAASYFQIVVALCLLIFGVSFVMVLGSPDSFWGNKQLRKFVADYSMPLIIVFFTGFTFFPGRISDLHSGIQRLADAQAFQPSESASRYGREHGWFIHFWNIPVGYVFLAIPFAILHTLLFYFDHNISSIMAQNPRYHFDKPATFHWDFLLLGCTTLVSGFLGLPAPNGLIPQAPLHVESLGTGELHPTSCREMIVDQRFTNSVQGLATIGLMTGPLLRVLHLVPQGILAGQFFMMGIPGLLNNELIRRLKFLVTEPKNRDSNEPLMKVPKLHLFFFLVICGLGTAGEIAITQTIAAIGFPGVLFVLMVIAVWLHKSWPAGEIEILDPPAASDNVMSSLDMKLRAKLAGEASNEENNLANTSLSSEPSAEAYASE